MTVYDATIRTCMQELFVIPVAFGVSAAAVLTINAISLLKGLRDKTQKIKLQLAAWHVFAIVGALILILIPCHLLKHGFFLPFEHDEDVICKSGCVTEIERDSLSPRIFFGDGTYSYASRLSIDGEEFYCLTYENIRVGDHIEAMYLPKSRIILRCAKEEGG